MLTRFVSERYGIPSVGARELPPKCLCERLLRARLGKATSVRVNQARGALPLRAVEQRRFKDWPEGGDLDQSENQ